MSSKTELVIGFIGQKGSGKTTAADMLEAEIERYYTWSVEHVNFAEELKQDVADRAGIDIDWSSYVIKDGYREELQEHGTAMREVHGADYWVKRWRGLLHDLGNPSVVLVSDVRYPIEASACDLIIKVVKDGLLDEDTHDSEHAWRGVKADAVIVNNGTLEQLAERVWALICQPVGALIFDKVSCMSKVSSSGPPTKRLDLPPSYGSQRQTQ